MRVRALPVAAVRATAGVTVLLALLLAPVVAAGPATAGGPTSVLLSAPAIGRTSSLYTTDPAYAELAEQVGANVALGSADESGAGAPGRPRAVGDMVTLTWLIHDVTVWRVDRVYVDAAGGPWIATQETNGGVANIWDAPEAWHRPAEPKALVGLLAAMGLLAGTSGAAGEATSPVADDPAQPDVAADSDGAAAAGSGGQTAAGTGTGSGAAADGFSLVLAGLLGLLAGGLATGVVAVTIGRRSKAARSWQDAAAPADDDVVSSGGALLRG